NIDTKTTAIIDKVFENKVSKTNFENHTEDKIELESYQPNKLVYTYYLKEDRLAVFSEIYYPRGWKVDVNGESLDLIRADYVLRAVMLPKGEHTVTFRFDPPVVKVGSTITLSTGILLVLLILGGVFYRFK